ncbi:MAG TPA: glycosyltransferase family 4 protein [Chloroflexia bacterium]|nr:glycosyltransferase family 4 protein [Chloroflexia bacterium]
MSEQIGGKIRVLQAAKSLGLGGTEKTLQIYTRSLNKDWFDVSVCGFLEGGVRGDQLRDEGYDVFVAGGSQDAISRYLRKKKFHIVHVHRHGQEAEVVMAAKAAGVPVIVETSVFGRPDFGPAQDAIDVTCHISKMTAIRYWAWTKISDKEFRRRCRVLYYPIEMESMAGAAVTPSEIEGLRERLGISEGARVIGRIGRPDATKWAVPFIIKMVRRLVRSVPDVVYAAMGAPDELKRAAKRAGLENHFAFAEPSADAREVTTFYRLLEVMPYASIGESFGLVVAEGMGMGLPVVVLSTPMRDNAQIELVDHGRTGLVAHDAKGCANAVARLLADPGLSERLGRAAQEKVREHYAAERVVRSLENLYADLLERKCPGAGRIIQGWERGGAVQPTLDEVAAFREEYPIRLRTGIGQPQHLPIWLYEHILLNYKFHQAGARSLSLLRAGKKQLRSLRSSQK